MQTAAGTSANLHVAECVRDIWLKSATQSVASSRAQLYAYQTIHTTPIAGAPCQHTAVQTACKQKIEVLHWAGNHKANKLCSLLRHWGLTYQGDQCCWCVACLSFAQCLHQACLRKECRDAKIPSAACHICRCFPDRASGGLRSAGGVGAFC